MVDIPFLPEHKLVAYADDLLPPDEMAQMAEVLARSPALAKRVARLKQTRAAISAAFDESMGLPFPDTVIQAASGRRRRLLHCALIALAATALVFLGLIVGRLTVPSALSADSPRIAVTTPQGTAAGPELSEFLDNAQSGQLVAVTPRLAVLLVLSFRSKDGLYCRQFEAGSGNHMMHGLACQHDGIWEIQELSIARRRPAGRQQDNIDQLQTDPVNRMIDEMIDGAPLDATQEATAVQNRWRVR